MKRGVVFHDEKDALRVAVLSEQGTFSEHDIGDEDRIYATMPRSKGEVVEVDDNEVIGVFTFRSLYGLTFFTKETEGTAHEAIRFAIQNDPEHLIEAISQKSDLITPEA